MSQSLTNRALGVQKNKLLRYQLIKNLYNETVKQHPDVPLTVVLKKYICPIYPISRTTLYEILCTPIASELKRIELLEQQQQNNQPTLFN